MNSKIWSFSAVGQDRPGIITALSKLLFEHKCNLSDSSMTILAGQFAIITILETSETTNEQRLQEAIQSLGNTWHLEVSLAPLKDKLEAHTNDEGSHLLVSVYGADQAGITWRVAELISAKGYNVTDLSTKKLGGSPPVYILLLEIESTPNSEEPSILETELIELGKGLSCSVSVKAVESSAL